MKRRDLFVTAGSAALGLGVELLCAQRVPQLLAAEKADITLRIAPVSVELAPGHTVKTTAYNGSAPGPVLRMREGKQITVEVVNETAIPELVHWHGQFIPPEVDGSAEEGTPFVPAHGRRRYTFTPRPAGTRWYHTHIPAERDLERATYTGQFGFVYVEPKNDPGDYDQEVFLALHEWEPFFTSEEEEEEEEGCLLPDEPRIEPAAYHPAVPEKENGLEVGYKQFSINGRSLGHGEPIRVRLGERVLFHVLNASATEIRKVALPGHRFTVLTMDGNPVPATATFEAFQLGPGERLDAIVEMNQAGVWIFGVTHEDDRKAGMGIVVEYANQHGPAKWVPPPKFRWDYTVFGKKENVPEPDARFELVFRKIPGGKGGYNRWTINGKSYPDTDPLLVRAGRRYRLILSNQSDDAHPVHLHRHSFELTNVEGSKTSGVLKDTVVVRPNGRVEVDLVANNPGTSLFHCHQQLHMDFGFMALLKYA
jgi:FtsP/CotA-like multicopper oxidase with cupredoxin domain